VSFLNDLATVRGHIEQIHNRTPAELIAPLNDKSRVLEFSEYLAVVQSLPVDSRNALYALGSIDDMVRSVEGDTVSVLEWTHLLFETDSPEEDSRVLAASKYDAEPVKAFYQHGHWFDAESLEQIDGIYAWAPMPSVPPPIEDEEEAG